MSQTAFVSHTPETAPAQVKPILEGARGQFGFIPSPMARMASSPAVVEGFLTLNSIFEKSANFSSLEREVLIMTVATYNGCHYCVAMHTAILKQQAAPDELISQLRREQPLGDARLRALSDFVRQVLQNRGNVAKADQDSFFAAGYTPQQALEVILGVAVYTISTYANRLTGAPLDAAFQAFQWQPQASPV